MRRAKHGAAGASQSARGEDTGLHRTAPASRPPLAAQVGEEKQPEAPAAAARAAAAGAAVEDSLEYSMEFESDDEGDGGDARLGATVKTSPGAVTSRAVMGEGKVDEGRLPPRGAAAESKERGGVRRQLSVEVADSNFEPGSARSLVEGDRACPRPPESAQRRASLLAPRCDSGPVAGLGRRGVSGAVLQPL